MSLKEESKLDNATDLMKEVRTNSIPDEIKNYAKNFKRVKGDKIEQVVSVWCYSETCKDVYLRTFAFKSKGDELKLFEVLRTSKDLQMYRNIYYTNMGGWHVVFVGDECKHWYYGYGRIIELENWEGRTNRFINHYGKIMNEELKNILEKHYPYLLKKYPNILNQCPENVFKVLKQYSKSTSIEWLLEKNMPLIATDKRLFIYTPKTKEKIIKFLQSKTDDELVKLNNIGLTGINVLIREKCSINDYEKMVNMRTTKMKDLKFFDKNGIKTTRDLLYKRYDDYLGMCEKNGHDIKQAYWRYPKDINEAHDKMMKEASFIQKSEDLAKFGSGLQEVYGELSKATEMKSGKYRIYIPTVYQDIEKQCDVLYQCLIRNDYIGKMLKKDFLLVFIRDMDDKPIATAQVYWNYEIGQFYTDERPKDRTKCIPNKELKELLNLWIETNKKLLIKPKGVAKVHYFKGFYKGMKAMCGNMDYKVGNIYDTGCKDEDFNVGCKSSNKAIHFCRDIKMVNRFIQADLIAEIEPMGVVCNKGDEYFSNRVKIIRIVENYA